MGLITCPHPAHPHRGTDEALMTDYSIPDMSCGHCKASVEAALATVPGSGPVEVDLPARRARVADAAAPAAVLAALDAAGFPATVLAG